MKKRGRKKKQVKQVLEINSLQPLDQDGPVLDLEKSIIKNLREIFQKKQQTYLAM